MIEKLDAAIKAVCPIYGVSIGLDGDKSTWRIDFMDEATDEQRKDAKAVLDAFDQSLDTPEVIDPLVTLGQLTAALQAAGLSSISVDAAVTAVKANAATS